MAEGIDSQKIDRNRIVDISNEELNEFTCSICCEIFVNPVFTQCCRQTYCFDCINKWVEENNTCPNDRKSLRSRSLSPAPRVFINLLNNLKVKCNFNSNGCQVISRLEDLAKHSSKCNFKPQIICQTCGIRIDDNSQHNCVKDLKLINDSISIEIKRMRKEMSKLKKLNTSLKAMNENNNISVRIINIYKKK